MSYSQLMASSRSIAEDICQSDNARRLANAVAPAVAKFGVTAATGSPVAGEAAGLAARVAAAKAPDTFARFAVQGGVAVALDLCTPVFLVAAAGYFGFKAAVWCVSRIDETLS